MSQLMEIYTDGQPETLTYEQFIALTKEAAYNNLPKATKNEKQTKKCPSAKNHFEGTLTHTHKTIKNK